MSSSSRASSVVVLASARPGAMSALASMRVNTMSKDVAAARAKTSTRDTMVLLHRHLLDNGYQDTADLLAREACVSLLGVESADDVSLELIFKEHEAHHVSVHGVTPALWTHNKRGGDAQVPDAKIDNVSSKNLGGPKPKASVPPKVVSGRHQQRSTAPTNQTAQKNTHPGIEPAASFGVVGVKAGFSGQSVTSNTNADRKETNTAASTSFDAENAQPIDFGCDDLNNLASVVQRDIFTSNPNVKWHDVAGLQVAKALLKESVTAPALYPELFTGLLSPWKGVLLHGPPGTGKTLLAKAVATECGSTFFNISASTVVSKYRGDSEKLIRVLFDLARHPSNAPSVVFMDEIDSLMSSRGGGGGEHEASRRMKTELLIQLDGLCGGSSSGRVGDDASGVDTNAASRVFLLAATNTPWALDPALLRRMEKRILIPLPDETARLAMLRKLLGDRKIETDCSLNALAKTTEHYSGSDVAVLCKEIAMRPVRRLVKQLDCMGKQSAPRRGLDAVGHITQDDIDASVAITKPSAANEMDRHKAWSDRFGQSA